jgi:hypothetical protein
MPANKYPSKVTIEITADRYTTTVFSGDEVLSKRSMVMENRARARGTDAGDIYEDLPDFEELAEAIDDESPFGIAGALIDIRDEYE